MGPKAVLFCGLLEIYGFIVSHRKTYQGVVGPCLKLSAPDTTKVDVVGTVSVGQDSRVDAVASWDEAWLGLELAIWGVGDGNTDTEDALIILGWEVEVELSIFFRGIGSPQLLGSPWHVREVQNLERN